MTERPVNIRTLPDIHALVDELAPESALRLALDILGRESGCFLLVMRLGDDDPVPPDGKRKFGIVTHDDMSDGKLVDAVANWVDRERAPR